MIGAALVSFLRRRAASAASLDTQTVTTGAIGTAIDQNRARGYISGSLGSISDGTSNIYAGAAVTSFYWDENGGTGMFYELSITGATNNSTDWTSVTIGGSKTLNRADATFASGTWTWTTTDGAGAQAFGGAGASRSCVFT